MGTAGGGPDRPETGDNASPDPCRASTGGARTDPRDERIAIGESSRATFEVQRTARVLEAILRTIPASLAAAHLVATISLWWAPNQGSLLWLVVMWIALGGSWFIGARAHGALVGDQTATADGSSGALPGTSLPGASSSVAGPPGSIDVGEIGAGRAGTATHPRRSMILMALIMGTAWSTLPVLAPPNTATGWTLDGMVLATVMVLSSLLFGLEPRLQPAIVAPFLLIGGTAIAIGGRNPGAAAATLLVLAAVPTFTLGGIARRVNRRADAQAEAGRHLARELARANAELSRRASHDQLTGLPNRSMYEPTVAEAGAGPRGFAVAFMDLDRFKQVNDRLGHVIGDQLLVATAERLRQVLRAGDAAMRDGGDEFVLVLRNIADERAAAAEGARLVRELAMPQILGDQTVSVGASMGIAVAPAGTNLDPDQLRACADQALYEAKRRGRNRCHVFDEELQQQIAAETERAVDLRSALLSGDIVGWFQPEVDLATGRIVGAECLAHWVRGDEVETATSFMGLAEKFGMTLPIMERNLLAAIEMQRRIGRGINLAVNVPPDEIEAALNTAVSANGGDLGGLVFEITETRMIQDPAALKAPLSEIRARGGRVLLDDFGTGFSSLSLLRDLPIDGVKIDRSFVDGLDTDGGRRAIVAGLGHAARLSNIAVVAEGVETPEQAAALRHLGVQRAQGFMYSRAIPVDEFVALVTDGTTLGAKTPTPQPS